MSTESADDALIDLVGRTCEGNPLYIEEMLKWLVEQGRIDVQDGHASLTAPHTGPHLPTSLAQLIAARIDALDAAGKGALQLASVIGMQFSERLVAEAAGLEDAAPLLTSLTNHGLIQRVELGRFTFASELVHKASTRGILRVQRTDYHRMVAAALEVVHADDLDSHAEALTRHCGSGGRPIDAARYAFKAGQGHEAEYALERAASLYQLGLKALENAPRIPDTWDARTQGEATLHLHLGKVLLSVGEKLRGMRDLQLALDISADAGLPWVEVRTHLELGRAYLERGRLVLSGAHLGQAQALLRIEPDRDLEQKASEWAAVLAFEQGKNAEAEALWQQALAHAIGDPAAEARCEIGLANRYLRNGRYDEAGPLLDRALIAVRSVDDRILEGRVLNNLGLMYSWAGKHQEALGCYRQSLEVREGMGYLRGVVVNHHNIADTHFQLGDWARAHVSFERSRDLARDMGWEHGISLNEVYLAYIEASQDNSDVTAILAATETARALGDAEITTTGGWLAGRFLAEQDRIPEARDQLERALDDARRWDLIPMIELIELTVKELAEPSKPTG
jgi:tetratricopeptide (TPR) repeat protein